MLTAPWRDLCIQQVSKASLVSASSLLTDTDFDITLAVAKFLAVAGGAYVKMEIGDGICKTGSVQGLDYWIVFKKEEQSSWRSEKKKLYLSKLLGSSNF